MEKSYKYISKWYDDNLNFYLKNGSILLNEQLKKFLQYISKDGKVLDIGSGTGQDVDYFVKKGFNAYGLDFSAVMIKYSKSNRKGKFFNMNMTNLKFNDRNFDGAWASSSLFTHLYLKDIKRALTEVYRVLKKEAIFGVIAMKKERNERTRVPKNFIFNTFTKKELLDYLKKNKFIPFYTEIFIAHDKKWFFILSKKK
ncbi:MAG: class I SAM-dependent methyltransferase [bacterium]|nr:class I SAM-dependent methyltransferase [bacterium]